MENTETTETVLTADQENTQVEIIVSASLANIKSNREKLEEVAKQYTGIKIEGIEDKANYKIVSAGITATRTSRTTVAKLVKGGKSLLDKAKKRLDEEGEALISIVAPVEQYLKDEKERIDTLKAEAEEERLRQEKEKEQGRIATLVSLGLAFNGSYWSMGELSLTSLQVTQYSEAQFEGFVSQAKVVYEAEQLRIAEEEEARRKAQEEADRKAEQERAEALKEQERLQKEAEAKQKELDEAARQRDIMRAEIAEHRVDVLRSKGFDGDLKLGYMFYGTAYRVTGKQIVDSNKAEWTEIMAAVNEFLEELQKPKKPIPAAIQAIVDEQPAPINGTTVKFTEEERGAIVEEVGQAFLTQKVASNDVMDGVDVKLTFTDKNPYIDTPVGKATLRIYVEQFVDQASAGLTKENVSASGSIGDQLLFLVIKPKV